MQVTAVSCNHCGAPLEVPETTRFVTCNYCRSRLAVKRTSGVTYTELLEQIGETTQDIAADTNFLRLKAEVELLESDWRAKQARATAVPDGSAAEACIAIAVVAVVLSFFTLSTGWEFLWGAVALLTGIAGWGNLKLARRPKNTERRRQKPQRRTTTSASRNSATTWRSVPGVRKLGAYFPKRVCWVIRKRAGR